DANRGAGVLEVAQGHEDIVATVGAGGGVRLDHDVVPGHVGPAASYASRLGERVSHRGEPPVGGVVDLAVLDDAHSARDGGQDGPAEADEQLRGLGAQERGRGVSGASTLLVDRDQIDRVGGRRQVRAVAGNTVGRAVSDQQPPGQRVGQVYR